MKIKNLFIGMLAFAATVACQEIVPEPTLEVDKAEVALAATASEATIKVTANNAWTATADAEWVTVTPASGNAAAEPVEVKVAATANEATEARTATVTVKAGELTKTVAVTQAAATAEEPEPEPEPEPTPVPEVDWTSEAVVSYDLPEGASEARQVLKNIKYQFDADYFYVKLEASKALFSEPATEYLGVFIYDVTNGSGDGYYGWWNEAAGNTEYEGEHVGKFTGTDLALTIGETPITVEKEENGDVLTWILYIPRTADANLALENPSFAFMTYVGWEPNGALPDKYDNMLQFTPTAVEPEPEPGLEQSDWNIVGSFTGSGWGWDAAAGIPLYVLDENYFVLYGLELTEGAQFKFLQGTAWGGPEVGASYAVVEPNTIQAKGGQNIAGLPAGKYDVYLAADASKFYIMSEGKTPAEATEPAPVETTYTVTGTIKDAAWNNAAPVGLMTKEGNYYVAKNIPFIWSSTAYAAYGNTDDQIELKIFVTGDWNQGWGAAAEGVKELNAEVAVSPAGGNIIYKNPEGTYDVYFDLENSKVWLMEAGKNQGETPAEPADVDIDGKQWEFTWNAMGGASCVLDLGVSESGVAIIAYDMGILDPSYAGIVYPYIMGPYTITKTDGTSGVVTITDLTYGVAIDIPYSNATENSVHFASAEILEEDIDCTLATTKIDIYLEVAEYLADGEYWIVADGKVAGPLVDKKYGYLPTFDETEGLVAENAFTFTQVEAGLYTIQDSNGKFYYQTGTYNSFNVSDTDGMTDEYLWEVYDTGNGEFAIINYSVGKFMQYDSSYGTYGSYLDERGTLPTLVPVE